MAVTLDTPSARATVRYLSVSPYKIRQVLQLVRGLPADDAIRVLQLCEKDAADDVLKLLQDPTAMRRMCARFSISAPMPPRIPKMVCTKRGGFTSFLSRKWCKV